MSRISVAIRTQAPTRFDVLLAILSAALLILAFPDFDFWPLAWVSLIPVILASTRSPQFLFKAFLIGWIMGSVFFFGSCYWLTYAMIRYGHIPTAISYLLLLPGAITVGLFPALFCLVSARLVSRFGIEAIFAAPFVWVSLEWARLGITGQLWNAIGYSQAFVPSLIQSAQWGGVYAVGFLIVSINAALAFFALRKTWKAAAITAGIVVFVALFSAVQNITRVDAQSLTSDPDYVAVIAVQPNVPMDPVESVEDTDALVLKHLALSKGALDAIKDPMGPRVVIWPESPMNFMYARDSQFREMLAGFTKSNRTSVIFNALEPAPESGSYNAAVMVNEEGRLVAQYDKIRLLPFGEFVPLPRWIPGASIIPVMVGNFTPGTAYSLMPLGQTRAGIFICFESAFPYIARTFANNGADVLINISNDGYLGPTPVRKQHLANAVFRAVENARPLLRVTNSGITAYITSHGKVEDATNTFETAVRTWNVRRAADKKTFYTRHGDVFVGLCAVISFLLLIGSGSLFGKSKS